MRIIFLKTKKSEFLNFIILRNGGSADLNIFRHRIEHFLYLCVVKIKMLCINAPSPIGS